MEIKRLGELCNIVSGGTPSRTKTEFWNNGTIPWVKIGDIKEKYINETDEFITKEGLDGSSTKMLPAGTILYTIFATLGEVGILEIAACTNQAIAGIMINDIKQLNTDYLYYYLKSKKTYVNRVGRGVAQNNINMSMLKALEVPVPELSKQLEIVKVIDKAYEVIEDRKQELKCLDNLIRARFVELFGDVKINQHNYKKVKIKQVLKSCEAGWSGNGTQRVKKDDEIAVLKVSAVTKGYFIPEECKVLDDQENIKKYVTPEKGDLLFSRANTREMVGATAIVREDYPTLILPDKLWKIRFNDSANVFYMKYVLSSKSIRNEFSASSTGTSGSMFNVSMDKFKEIEIPIAPIELQNQFADFVQAIDKSKLQYYPHTHTCQPNTS